MAGNRTICTQNNIDYMQLRMAMCSGARTVDDMKQAPGVCGNCEGCQTELPQVLSSVCGCSGVSMQDVIHSIKNGADTVEKVTKATGAGGVCGRCQKLVANIIELGY